MENGIGYLLNSRGHCVLGIYRADNSGPAFVTAVVLNANALYVGNRYKVLPYLLCESTVVKLLAENCVSLAQSVESVAGDSTEATNTEAGSGERLTVYHCVRKSERLADYSYLVLKEKVEENQ